MNRALTLYHRVGCSLCEAMQEELQPYRQQLGFELEMVDIDTSAELQQRYGERVPVLAGETGEICHYFLDPERLHGYFASS